MTLGRYILLIGSDATSQGGACIDHISERTGLNLVTKGDGFAILGTARDMVLPLPGSGGALIGTLFALHGPSRRILPQDDKWLEELAGADRLDLLSRRFWGGYIAVLVEGGHISVARDPGGAMPCYCLKTALGWVLTSDAGLLVSAGLLKPVIAWETIPRYLVAKDLPCTSTAIDGLEELLPGTLRRFLPEAREPETFWSPWDHMAPPDKWDEGLQAERLRRTVDHCVASWASTADRALATLSGGLDSSIVVAALATSRCDFHCATMVTANANGDERDYARAMSEAVGARLHEPFYDHHDIDLSCSVARHFPKPIGQIHEVAYHAAMVRLASEIGADSVFTGNGGDNVFYNSSSVRPFFDCVRAKGPGLEALRTLRDIGQITETSVWTAAWAAVSAIGAMRRPYRWTLNLSMLAPAIAAQMIQYPPTHAWLDTQRADQPGKAGQVAFLLRVQNHLEGYLRVYGLPMVNPLMSQPVVEMALAIPTWKMVEGGRDRAVARRAYANALPLLVRERRRKGSPSGFAMEVLERNGPEIRARLLDGELVRRQLVDAAAIELALARGPAMGLSYVRILTLLDMEAWIAAWRGIKG
jgi:asparagine synthase (glutamine-hydrolysing)